MPREPAPGLGWGTPVLVGDGNAEALGKSIPTKE